MTFLTPSAFYFLTASAFLILISFLRSRSRRSEVSALFLWVGLTEAPEPHAVKLRRWMDPLLFLQLAVLAMIVFAMVQPMWRTKQTVFSGLALVLDASASMHTQTDEGRTRYDLAVGRIREILAEASSARMTLIQYSSQSAVLVPPTADEGVLLRALGASEPSWSADGTVSGLVDVLSAVGGLDSFDRIIIFSDNTPSDLPPGVDVELFQDGRNVGITAFTVRENLTGPGASAFLELRNETDAYLEPQVTIRDEFFRTTVSFLLGPTTTDQYVVPLPLSRGTQFTATLELDDDFRFDNVRYFSLARPSSLRVRWIGPDNRFLRAALESVLPLTLVAADEPADLTVIVGQTLDELADGNVVLVQSQITGIVRLGDRQKGGFAEVEDDDHPLLVGIEADAIYVEELPATEFFVPVTPLLSVNNHPLVTEVEADQRSILAFSTDLTSTNLPITVDFPLLIRNLLASMQRLPSPLVHEWRNVGHLIDAGEFGTVRTAVEPTGRIIELSAEQRAIPTNQPGFYRLETGNGVIPVAINIDSAESVQMRGETWRGSGTDGQFVEREIHRRLWPYLALAALVLLLAEAIVYVQKELTGGRTA